MKIYLVNPVFSLSLWDFSLSRDLDGNAYPHPPLALPTIAALTPPEHEVTICDENVDPVNMGFNADIVGITGYYIQRERVFELANSFRARGITVAIGGPLVDKSSVPECALHADTVFMGEAEYSWPTYLNDFKSGHAESLYIQNDFVDLKDSPPPRYELLNYKAYSTGIIETSRGCPYACEFCEIPVRLGTKSRAKSVEQVMMEVRAQYELGADSIFFIDDHFIGNRKRTLELLFEISKFVRLIDYKMYYSCQFTINFTNDRELLALLHAANFKRVFIGIETPREVNLKNSKKEQNLKADLIESVRLIQSYNIVVWASLIVGFDEDDTKIFEEQKMLLQAAGIPVAMIGLLQALPGTPLYKRMVDANRIGDKEIGGVRGTYADLLKTNIIPLKLTPRELARGYQRLMKEIYAYAPFTQRLTDAIRRAKMPHHKSGPKAWKSFFPILLRILRYYLMTTDLGRIRMFFQVVIVTMIHSPQQLETALMHLVVYKHLRTFFRKVASLPMGEYFEV